MTNSQRRATSRNRRPAKPRFTPEAYQLELSLRQLEVTRTALLADERREANLARVVPTSGPQRRRAKARRNAQADSVNSEETTA